MTVTSERLCWYFTDDPIECEFAYRWPSKPIRFHLAHSEAEFVSRSGWFIHKSQHQKINRSGKDCTGKKRLTRFIFSSSTRHFCSPQHVTPLTCDVCVDHSAINRSWQVGTSNGQLVNKEVEIHSQDKEVIHAHAWNSSDSWRYKMTPKIQSCLNKHFVWMENFNSRHESTPNFFCLRSSAVDVTRKVGRSVPSICFIVDDFKLNLSRIWVKFSSRWFNMCKCHEFPIICDQLSNDLENL